VGWECEVRLDGRATGERRLADMYIVAEVAPNANDIGDCGRGTLRASDPS